MLLTILDGTGNTQKVIAHSQEEIVDHSGVIIATNVPQEVIPANAFRSGWTLQNLGAHDMFVNDIGAATSSYGSYLVTPKATIKSSDSGVSINTISVSGTVGESFTCREW